MPKVKVKDKTNQPVSSSKSEANLPASDYRAFINDHLGNIIDKKKKKVTPKAKSLWKEPSENDEGQIINEIAKKFNKNNTLGIPISTYKPGGKGSSTHYWINGNNLPQLDLLPKTDLKYGPNPLVIAHELMHGNDNQSSNPLDHLNPFVWNNLQTLANTGGAEGNQMENFEQFVNSVGKIQNIINPPGEFRESYPIDADYIKNDIRGATDDQSYNIPLKQKAPDWPTLFNKINSVVNARPREKEKVPNQGFYLNRASEFPAFMSESLMRSWHTNQGTKDEALTLPEATFAHSTLGDMMRSYDGNDYPTMNKHILARRKSIEDAYKDEFPINNNSNSSSSSSSKSSSSRQKPYDRIQRAKRTGKKFFPPK